MLNIYKINYKKLLINRDLTKTIIKEGVDNYLLLIVSLTTYSIENYNIIIIKLKTTI